MTTALSSEVAISSSSQQQGDEIRTRAGMGDNFSVINSIVELFLVSANTKLEAAAAI